MSAARGIGGEQPRKVVLSDASGPSGRLDVPGFATEFVVVGAVDPTDGTPRVRDEDHAFFEPRAIRIHDLQRKTPDGRADRRFSPQIICDADAEYADGVDAEAPYRQSKAFTAANRSTRIVGGAPDDETILPSHARVIGSEDGRSALALTVNEVGFPTKADREKAEQARQAAEDAATPLPDGVAIRRAGTEVGTGGVVTRTSSAVIVQGLAIGGDAAVAAALEVARAGGSAQAVRDAALAAALGQPAPVLRAADGTVVKLAPPPKPAGPAFPTFRRPAGHVVPALGGQSGLLGTLLAPSAGAVVANGRKGQRIATLPLHRDHQLALDLERRGPWKIKDEDCARAPDNADGGLLIKGFMMPDTSEAGRDFPAVPGETLKMRPCIYFKFPPGDTIVPPPPPQPPKPPEPPPPVLRNPTGDFVPFKVTPPAVVIPSPTGDGSAWVLIHNRDDTLDIVKLPPGTFPSDYVIPPGDSTVATLVASTGGRYGLRVGPDGSLSTLTNGNATAMGGGGGGVASVTAGDATITVGGTGTNPTVKVSASTVASIAAAGKKSLRYTGHVIVPGGSGIQLFGDFGLMDHLTGAAGAGSTLTAHGGSGLALSGRYGDYYQDHVPCQPGGGVTNPWMAAGYKFHPNPLRHDYSDVGTDGLKFAATVTGLTGEGATVELRLYMRDPTRDPLSGMSLLTHINLGTGGTDWALATTLATLTADAAATVYQATGAQIKTALAALHPWVAGDQPEFVLAWVVTTNGNSGSPDPGLFFFQLGGLELDLSG